jgi:hypothetical protein
MRRTTRTTLTHSIGSTSVTRPPNVQLSGRGRVNPAPSPIRAAAVGYGVTLLMRVAQFASALLVPPQVKSAR